MFEPDANPSDAASSRPLPSLDLRPLSTGELLDRVFSLYRSRFTLFLLIALVPAALGLVGSAAQLLLRQPGVGTTPTAASIATSIVTIVASLLSLVGYAIGQAATTRLVSQIYLGEPGEPGKALREAWPRTFRYVGIQLWQVWSGIWLPVLLGVAGGAAIALRQRRVGDLFILLAAAAFVYGVIAYLRNTLAIPASVLESLGVRAAIRRSKVLVSGRKGRIFLLFLLIVLLAFVAFAVESVAIVYLARAKAPVQHAIGVGLQLGLSFAVSLLLAPVTSIALCLFYFDERVRREGFDIDFLMRGSAALGNRDLPIEGAAGMESL